VIGTIIHEAFIPFDHRPISYYASAISDSLHSINVAAMAVITAAMIMSQPSYDDDDQPASAERACRQSPHGLGISLKPRVFTGGSGGTINGLHRANLKPVFVASGRT
jgi:hypothetical protein